MRVNEKSLRLDPIPSSVYRWAVHKQAEMRDRPTSQECLTERTHGPQMRHRSSPEKGVHSRKRAVVRLMLDQFAASDTISHGL